MPHPIADELALIADPAVRAARKALRHAEEPTLRRGKTWQRTVGGDVWTLRVATAPALADTDVDGVIHAVLRFKVVLRKNGVLVPWNDDGILELGNPYTKVEDPAGDIPVTSTRPALDPVTGQRLRNPDGTPAVVATVVMYREDCAAAMREMVLDALRDALR